MIWNILKAATARAAQSRETRRTSKAVREPMTEASVVICAHTPDRWEELNRAVGSVRNQTPAPREIVVVVDNNEPC